MTDAYYAVGPEVQIAYECTKDRPATPGSGPTSSAICWRDTSVRSVRDWSLITGREGYKMGESRD